jgi:hypothetical protein
VSWTSNQQRDGLCQDEAHERHPAVRHEHEPRFAPGRRTTSNSIPCPDAASAHVSDALARGLLHGLGQRARLRRAYRGHLACPSCSGLSEPTVVTASLSRGNGGAYAYYHCHRCGGFRARSADVHEAVSAFLRGLRLPKGTADVYRALAEEMRKTSVEEREAEKKATAAEVERGEAKLLRA